MIGRMVLEFMSGRITFLTPTLTNLTISCRRIRLVPTHSLTNPHGNPRLVLEAAILEHGLTWTSLPAPTKTNLSKSSSTALKLWEKEVNWHLPLPTLQLHTTPGVNYLDPQEPPASDFLIRWTLGWIHNEGRKGHSAASGDAWLKYLADPVPTYASTLAPFSLVVSTSENPILVAPPTGNTVSILGPARQFNSPQHIMKDIVIFRKGKKLTLKPRLGPKKVSLPMPVGKPKYSTEPLPQFKLALSALPPGTPESISDSATRAFAASISLSSQSSYKTALVHLEKAEAILGQKFSSPPTEQEIIFFTAYLAGKNVTSATIKSYLSGLRYISLSRGAAHHTKLPELGAQIVAGSTNMKKDAHAEASKPKRRPITLEMLVLLRHAIATNETWNDVEKCLRWSCMLLGYWGSFRMGELLETEKSKFHPGSSLLPSDIKFHEDSVAIWIRTPKVWKHGGDIVEVWSVKENKELDPVLALNQYMKVRSQTLGPAGNCPVFLHRDGSQYTKAELNKDIKLLLAQYPTISSPRDRWSGHSFRAGISTLLSSLGFKEEQIKNWGRWSSMAYTAYVQDQTQRRDTRKQITKVFGQMLAKI